MFEIVDRCGAAADGGSVERPCRSVGRSIGLICLIDIVPVGPLRPRRLAFDLYRFGGRGDSSAPRNVVATRPVEVLPRLGTPRARRWGLRSTEPMPDTSAGVLGPQPGQDRLGGPHARRASGRTEPGSVGGCLLRDEPVDRPRGSHHDGEVCLRCRCIGRPRTPQLEMESLRPGASGK